jgi:hypothetical protein
MLGITSPSARRLLPALRGEVGPRAVAEADGEYRSSFLPPQRHRRQRGSSSENPIENRGLGTVAFRRQGKVHSLFPCSKPFGVGKPPLTVEHTSGYRRFERDGMAQGPVPPIICDASAARQHAVVVTSSVLSGRACGSVRSFGGETDHHPLRGYPRSRPGRQIRQGRSLAPHGRAAVSLPNALGRSSSKAFPLPEFAVRVELEAQAACFSCR